MRAPLPLLPLLIALAQPLAAGCSGIAVALVEGAVTGGGLGFASDDDPDLVRDAAPFALKTIEGLLSADPRDPELLLAATSGFTQYAYAFVQQDAERLDEEDLRESRRLYERARKLYLRARVYGMRGLSALAGGFRRTFARDRKAAVKLLDADAVPLLYWTAAAWAAHISISKHDAKLLGELPDMEALMARALELDPDWGAGAIHEFYIAYEGGRDESQGGSVERARRHFERAVALSRGRRVGPWVSWAESVSARKQNKPEFVAHLDRAIAFDANEAPEFRLVNLISQDRARRLKARAEDLFAE